MEKEDLIGLLVISFIIIIVLSFTLIESKLNNKSNADEVIYGDGLVFLYQQDTQKECACSCDVQGDYVIAKINKYPNNWEVK